MLVYSSAVQFASDNFQFMKVVQTILILNFVKVFFTLAIFVSLILLRFKVLLFHLIFILENLPLTVLMKSFVLVFFFL